MFVFDRFNIYLHSISRNVEYASAASWILLGSSGFALKLFLTPSRIIPDFIQNSSRLHLGLLLTPSGIHLNSIRQSTELIVDFFRTPSGFPLEFSRTIVLDCCRDFISLTKILLGSMWSIEFFRTSYGIILDFICGYSRPLSVIYPTPPGILSKIIWYSLGLHLKFFQTLSGLAEQNICRILPNFYRMLPNSFQDASSILPKIRNFRRPTTNLWKKNLVEFVQDHLEKSLE